MRETCTNGNGRNGVRPGASRVTVYTEYAVIVDRFEVPARNGLDYCKRHPRGEYARRLKVARETARRLDREWKGSGQLPLIAV